MITGKFVIRVGDDFITYNNYDDIPEKFDNVIEFIPDFPEGPHTEHEHGEMNVYGDLLQKLIKRETNASSN